VTSSPVEPHSDLEELARAATQGEWKFIATDGKWRIEAPRVCVTADESLPLSLWDAEFIAASNPARILSLIGEVRELQRLLEDLTPGGSEFHDDPQRCAQYVRERLATVARVQAENRKHTANVKKLRQFVVGVAIGYEGTNLGENARRVLEETE
jgi:hypothetical protein